MAREIVDQEEAVAAERKERQRQRRAAATSAAVRIRSRRIPRSTVKNGTKSINRPIIQSLVGLFVFWAINGSLRLYAMSSETSLYRTVLIWAIPLTWLGFVWLRWARVSDKRGRPQLIPGQARTKAQKAQDQKFFQALGLFLMGLALLVLILMMAYKGRY
jgi:hypothetical protein